MKKILLVTLPPKSHRTSEENLGLLYLASSLREKNYEVEVYDAWLNDYSFDKVYNKVISEDYLFIGFSSYMTNTKITIDMINKIKENNKNINVVCGGFGPTFYPHEHLLSGADIVSLGEGEETIIELAEYFLEKRSIESVKNIGYIKDDVLCLTSPRPLLERLDNIPFPSRDLLDLTMKNKSSVSMLTSRGCTGNCNFCSVIAFFRLTKGKIYRTRSVKNIVEEIAFLYEKGVRFIKFVDDSFIDGNRDERWCEEFSNEIKEKNIKVHLRGQIRADKVTDKIMYFLSEAGFFSFACGIENGSDTALKRMNKKADKKTNQKVIDIFNKYSVIMQMGFILFDKDTTIEELKENYNFLLNNKKVITKGIFSEMFSATGTKLNNDLLEANELIEISDFISNNNKYEIVDDEVKVAYEALKIWHKSHSEIYDKLIDPITAPKAIGLENIHKLTEIFALVKERDLEIFKYVLDCIEENMEPNIYEKIKENKTFYKDIEKNINEIYDISGLEYNAEKNPFI